MSCTLIFKPHRKLRRWTPSERSLTAPGVAIELLRFPDEIEDKALKLKVVAVVTD
jgi:hypothetical protein